MVALTAAQPPLLGAPMGALDPEGQHPGAGSWAPVFQVSGAEPLAAQRCSAEQLSCSGYTSGQTLWKQAEIIKEKTP